MAKSTKMEEEKYMRRCIELAKNGLCNVSPNPMVGAVIVCDGRIIGEGYHIRCGEAHAEVNAIRSVKDESLLKRSTILSLACAIQSMLTSKLIINANLFIRLGFYLQQM